MTTDFNWYPFFPTDWLADTRGLDPDAVGVFYTLCMMMLESEGPLKEDTRRLARYCGCKREATFKKVLELLLEDRLLIRVEEGILSERVAKMIEKRAEKSRIKSKAARVRHQKDKQNQGADDADALHPQCNTEADAEAEAEAYPYGERPNGLSPSGDGEPESENPTEYPTRSAPVGAPRRYQVGQIINHPKAGELPIRAVKNGFLEVDYKDECYAVELRSDGTFGDLKYNEVPF